MSTANLPDIQATVLLVDDDESVLRAHARLLEKRGCEVAIAGDGEAALALLGERSFDVILSDLEMPRMNGIKLLEQIRAHDLDVPVLFITGTPTVETAMRAIEHGAFKYLVKPVEPAELARVVTEAARLGKLGKAKRRALEMVGGIDRLIGDQAGLVTTFTRALETLYIAFQPIVSWSHKSIFAYEALLRSREPALPHPGAMLEAAERLGRLNDLGRKIRARAAEAFSQRPDDGALLFVNLHPADLSDRELRSHNSPLAALAHRVVLEITERQSLHGIPDARGSVTTLHDRGFRIAIDDLGAGYAGLESFAILEPQVAKLDMSLVRGIDQQPTKQAIVRTMIELCRELEITVIAEGIETAQERDALALLGCDLMQGYLFARPAEGFPAPKF